jgi:aminoglycoside phosphotransferase (APT) family kinase protein
VSTVIEQHDVARYMLERSLLDPAAVLDGELAIHDASSRNRNYRVEYRGGPSYLIKQPVADDGIWTVANEAGIYHRLADGADSMAPYLPRFYGYDPDERVLVLELLQDAEDLRRFHMRTGDFAVGPAALVGSALGVLHRTTETRPDADVSDSAAWILSVHRPDARLFRDVSAAGLELIRVIQGAVGFPAALDRLREQWLPVTLVHGDVKWDNCLRTTRDDGNEEVRLIDWESASLGDPGWDIGSALSQYLSFWLFSIPVTGVQPPEQFPKLARYPLDEMKPALAACWQAYVRARRLDDASTAHELIRAVRFAGARLIQTAFEASQMMQQLTSSTVLHLQLAFNILERPDAAAGQLMGLALPSSVAR